MILIFLRDYAIYLKVKGHHFWYRTSRAHKLVAIMQLMRTKTFVMGAASILFLLSSLWFTFNPTRGTYEDFGDTYDLYEMHRFDVPLLKREFDVPLKYLGVLGMKPANQNGSLLGSSPIYNSQREYVTMRSRWNLTLSALQLDGDSQQQTAVVTAITDQSDAQDILVLLHSMEERLKNVKAVVFSVGYWASGEEQVAEFCNMTSVCTVEVLPLSLLPAHIGNTKNGAYIPLLLQKTLSSGLFTEVLWADPTVRFHGSLSDLSSLRSLLHRSGSGVVAAWSAEVSPGKDIADPVSSKTNPEMYSYFTGLTSNSLYFYQLLSGHAYLIAAPTLSLPSTGVAPDSRLNSSTEAAGAGNTLRVAGRSEKVLRLWVSCCLTRECIAPAGSQRSGCAPRVFPMYKYRGCHQFEISALGVSLRMELGPEQTYLVQEENGGWKGRDKEYSLLHTSAQTSYKEERKALESVKRRVREWKRKWSAVADGGSSQEEEETDQESMKKDVDGTEKGGDRG